MSAEKIFQEMAESMPLSKAVLDLRENVKGYGLIIVDEVIGFAEIGRVKTLLTCFPHTASISIQFRIYPRIKFHQFQKAVR